MKNNEFKIKDINRMTDEEILWALKKIPRNNFDTRTKTLFIGVLESMKYKLKTKEKNCMKTVKNQKEKMYHYIELLYSLEPESKTYKTDFSNICKEARKEIEPVEGYKDLRFNGKTMFWNDILPDIKAGEKYSFFIYNYKASGEEILPFNFEVGAVAYSRNNTMQWIAAKSVNEDKYKIYYVNGNNYCLKVNEDKTYTLDEAKKAVKETAEADDSE